MTEAPTINETIDGFGPLMTGSTRRVQPAPCGLSDVLKRIRAATPKGGRRRDAIREAASLHIRARISERFPLLDAELFRLKRYLRVEFPTSGPIIADDTRARPRAMSESMGKTQVRWIEVPLLQSVTFSRWSDRQPEATLGRVSVPGTSGRQDVRVNAKFPSEIGPVQKQRGREARSLVHEILAEMILLPAMDEAMDDMSDHTSFLAYWIPSTQSLSVQKVARPAPTGRDPAYVMEFRGDRYLLSLWEADGEEPLEAILREFSTGPWVEVK